MIIPKKISDGPKTIFVDYVTPLQHEDAGSYCHYAGTISLWKVNKHERFLEADQAETLMHEMCERINSELDLKLKHHQLTAISQNLFRLIRDNKLDFLDTTVEESNLETNGKS